MSIRTTEIGGHTFVGGLFWQTITKPRRERRQEIKTLAYDLRFDFAVIRQSSTPQAGFASRDDGAEEGMLSLAAVISKSLEMDGVTGNWIGAFLLPDGDYAYVVARNDIFLSEGDMIGTHQEVLQKMTADYSLGDWDYVFAPSEFDFQDAIERDVESLIPMKGGKVKIHKWWQITTPDKLDKKIHLNFSKRTMVAGSLLILAIMGGTKFYLVKKEKEEEVAREQAMAAVRAQLMQQKDAAKRAALAAAGGNMPWSQIPIPTSFASACLSAFDTKVAGGAGWNLTHFSCSSTGIAITYDRGGSNIKQILSAFPNAQINDTGDEATVSIPLAGNWDTAAELLIPTNQARNRFVSTAQSIGAQFSVKTIEAPKTLPGQKVDENAPPPPPWNQLSFTILSAASPITLARSFSLPGVRFMSFSYEVSSQKWTAEGVMYGN